MRQQFDYVVGLDAGITKDRAALALVHDENGEVILDRLDCWAPSPGQRIQLDRIDTWLEEVYKAFHIYRIVIDPYQLEFLAQKWEPRVTLERYSFQAGGHRKIGENLKTLFTNKKIRIYPNAGQITLQNGTTEDLVDELSTLITQEQGNVGLWRVNHRPGGHDDRYCALALACWGCVNLRKRTNINEMLDRMLSTKPSQTELKQTQKETQKEEQETQKRRFTMAGSVQYRQVQYLGSYGSYVAKPIINNTAMMLGDFPLEGEAAYQVNVAYELLGLPSPNDILEAHMPTEERKKVILADAIRRLKQRKILDADGKLREKYAPKKPEPPTKDTKKQTVEV